MLPDSQKAIQDGYKLDLYYSKVASVLQEEAPPGVQFVKRDGLVYHLDAVDGRLRLCVPKSLYKEIFAMAHD